MSRNHIEIEDDFLADLETNTSTIIGIQQQKGLTVELVVPGMTLVGYKGEGDSETGVVLVCFNKQEVAQAEQIGEKQYKILIGTKCACLGECQYPALY